MDTPTSKPRITETREMIRVDDHDPGTFTFLQDEGAVLFIEDSGVKYTSDEVMPHMMLREAFARNAKRVVVTVTIVE